MKLYVGTCGLGLGHITRCERIAREVSEKGDEVLFSSYLDGLDYLKRKGLRHYSATPISFKTREDGTIDPKLTATQNGVTVGLWKFVKQLIGEVQQLTRFRPDIVISDTRVSTLLAGMLLRKPTCLILNQYSVQMPKYPNPKRTVDRIMLLFSRIVWKYASTLLGIAWGMSKLIIIPDLPPPYTISTYNLPIPKRTARKVKLVGPVGLKGKAETQDGRAAHHTQSVFACVSGPATDRQYLVRMLSRLLAELPPKWRVVLCCGDPKGSSAPKHDTHVTVFDWMDEKEYDEAFRNADVIVSRAGHETIMRAVALGKPLVLIPPPSHTEQSNNARRAAELGIAVVLPQSALDGDSLVRAVKECTEKCSGRAVRISGLIQDKIGTETIAETIANFTHPNSQLPVPT